jgi:hypothetical protein
VKRLHILLAIVLILALAPLGALAGDGPVPGASSPLNVQGGENRIALQSILHIQTTDTTQSVIRALNELGYAYDLINSSDWTGINFAPYDIVIIGMDGGTIYQPSVQKIRTDVIDQGKRAIFLGGTCWYEFAVGVNDYLVLNDINNYCWTISGTPHWNLVDPGHGLADGLPSSYNFTNTSAAYYQMRATDPDIEVVAVNGDGFDQFFYKGDNFPVTEGGISQGGDFIWFIDSVYSSYWTNQADFDVLKQLIANAITYEAGEQTMHVEDITGWFDYPYLQMRVLVCDQSGAPLGNVFVDTTITMPSAEWGRWRYTRPNGWARFWAPTLVNGNYQICVDNLVLAGYTYNPDDNVWTCMDWDY